MEKEHSLPKKNIIIVVIALVLLGGLFTAWYIYKDNVPQLAEEAGKTEKNGSYELFSTEVEKIKSVKIKSDEGETVITKEGDKITVSPADENLNEAVLEYYLENYTQVYAVQEVKDGYKRISEYGIKEDDNYFEITLNDGTVRRFCIGNTIDGYYYCLDVSDKTVWLVPSMVGSILMAHPEVKTENTESFTVSIDYQNIFYVGIENAGTPVFEVRRVGNSTALPYNFYSTYEIMTPFTDIAYGTKFNSFLKALGTSVYPQGHVGATGENAEVYGIGNGYTLTVKDGTKTHTLTFGNRSDIGVYMTYNDYPYIYIVSDDILNIIENVKPQDYMTPYIDLYEVDDVKEIVIKSDGKVNTLTIDNAKKKYSLNGKSLSGEDFNKLYEAISDIVVYEGVESAQKKGSVACEISYKLSDGRTYNRKYYNCQSAMIYMTNKESGVETTVKKATVDNILKIIEELT